MASDLSGLSERPLKQSQECKSRRACFKVGDGGTSSCTFETDIELIIIGVLLMRDAEIRNYSTDSEIYNEKRIDPRTEPCGTPER